MLRRKLLIATGAFALAVPTVAYADTGVDRFDEAPSSSKLDTKFTPSYLDSDAKVTVMVELTGDPVAVVEGQTGEKLSASRVTQIRSGLKKSQDRVKKEITGRGGKVFSQMQSAYNGMRVQLPRKQVRAVSQLPGVKAVRAIQQQTINNATSVPFLGVPQVWQSSKYRGEGVKVAIIDTGIDYTHANFAGPGTVQAFDKAKASDTPNPKYFGPNAPRVKGGYDFVGDDYDASVEGSLPKPDANPLDCNGHGSHVAGTTGGNGVTDEGTTYKGPYNSKTPDNDFLIGPGVAPKVDLYALKVFGCEGSTDVTTEAIDWAVAHDMDVINMSLGSTYGDATDPSAVAATNAQAAGVVVVASAGNSGPNPYMTGSPGTGKGVVSVAAVDSTATFPGASLSFGGTTMDAVNANGANLPEGPYTIVNTNSLGCDTASFTAAGISSDPSAPLQIAIVNRGTCARVAKAIFGQQAGADAVIMVNNVDSYPPVEGEITSNPDTGEAYTVTIPFLGVRSSDGAALVAAAGTDLTLSAKDLQNPDFKAYASFSSGGPRNNDSGLKPSISAPGVSIVSTGVGTGNGPATISGTSMAAPHVAGVAALARQAHKGWSSNAISAALVSTADPAKVSGYRLTLGGGLVDTKQVVNTSIYAIGDQHKTAAGKVSEATLSFGFKNIRGTKSYTKTITLVNKGSKRVIFTLANQATSQSSKAKVTFSKKLLTVPAKSSKKVTVKLTVKGSDVGTSLSSDDLFNLREVSGNIKIGSNGKGTLRVPYLLVPRAQAMVEASQSVVDTTAKTTGKKTVKITGGKSVQTKVDGRGKPKPNPSSSGSPSPSPSETTTSPSPSPSETTTSPSPSPTEITTSPSPSPSETTAEPTPEPTEPAAPTTVNVKLTNPNGALPAAADFYTWGLRDEKDVSSTMGRGFDLRAAGVQSFADGDDQLLVFAVNNWSRWSTAATQEFDVLIDSDRDGNPDWIVFSYDSGIIRADDPNGITEVFLYDIANRATYAAGFYAQAPTDSSTILLPVYASDLGISEDSGTFDYGVASYSILNSAAADEMPGLASYNPWQPSISNGGFATVPVNGSRTVEVSVDADAVADQQPLGTMVVVLDNKAGMDEALTLPTP
ncbi:S8 family peptidase [Micropruina sonneratiae]|uniref:S8 family peptidase n=1 Tax=Micropruina sonneratiae TaxID=2986940 RepID=UPI00222674F2|nr:S8 family serine peptidase [Micropruina sp. KQZ13P-5]MCW3156595.1 S8 family serine peptidase [Micropruina sp. KQZ13P-5]